MNRDHTILIVILATIFVTTILNYFLVVKASGDGVFLNVPQITQKEECDLPPTPRPVGLEFHRTKLERLAIRADKLEVYLSQSNVDLTAAQFQLDTILAIKSRIKVIPSPLALKIKELICAVEKIEKKPKQKCCVIL